MTDQAKQSMKEHAIQQREIGGKKISVLWFWATKIDSDLRNATYSDENLAEFEPQDPGRTIHLVFSRFLTRKGNDQ